MEESEQINMIVYHRDLLQNETITVKWRSATPYYSTNSQSNEIINHFYCDRMGIIIYESTHVHQAQVSD